MALPVRTLPVSIPSTLPEAEARRRLEAMHDRTIRFLTMVRGIHVQLTPAEGGTRVQANRHAGRNLIAVLEGELRAEGSGCRLEGTASVHPLTWYLPAAVALFVAPINLLVFGVLLQDNLILLLLVVLGGGFSIALMGLLVYSQALTNRRRLADAFTKALEGTEAPRS